MKNESGLEMVQDKVLLLPDAISEETEFGIIKPDIVKAQEQMAQTKATIIDVGPNAFEAWDKPIPVVGDRVYVCRYSGIDGIRGADDKRYKITPDEDITAIINKDPDCEDFKGTRQPLSR